MAALLDYPNAPHLPVDPILPPREAPAPTRGQYRPSLGILKAGSL